MSKSRIRMSHHPEEPVPPNTFSDFAWIRENEESLLEK